MKFFIKKNLIKKIPNEILSNKAFAYIKNKNSLQNLFIKKKPNKKKKFFLKKN